MGMFRRTAYYGLLAWLCTALRLWPRLWLFGLVKGAWLVFSLKLILRAVARRRRRPTA